MPYPDNLNHHFVVDPTKSDFYAMDCYRHLAEDRLAENPPARSSRQAPTSTEPNEHRCDLPKHA